MLLLTDNRWKVEGIRGYLWFSYTEHQDLPPSKLLLFEWLSLSVEAPNILSPITRYCFLLREWPKKPLSSDLVPTPFTLLVHLLIFPFPLNLQTPSLWPQMGFGPASQTSLAWQLYSSILISPVFCCGYQTTRLELLVQLSSPATDSCLPSPTSFISCPLLRWFLALISWLLMLCPPESHTQSLIANTEKASTLFKKYPPKVVVCTSPEAEQLTSGWNVQGC